MTDTQHLHLAEMSKHIEVLLHASEAPLTAHDLKKHLSVSSKDRSQTSFGIITAALGYRCTKLA